MGRIISIEGPDGSGKTTTAENLAVSLGYVCLKTPSEPFRLIRAQYDKEGVKPRDRFDFYLEGVRRSVEDADLLFKRGIPGVVMDRFDLSLEIYHSILDPETDYSALMIDALPRPDFQIVLTAPLEELASRIAQRNARYDVHLEKNNVFIGKVLDAYLKRSVMCKSTYDFLHVDTLSTHPGAVLELCETEFKRRLLQPDNYRQAELEFIVAGTGVGGVRR